MKRQLPALPHTFPEEFESPLTSAVRAALGSRRNALFVGAGVLAAGLAVASDGPPGTSSFPAVIELASLLPPNGGDGTVGFVLLGVDQEDHAGIAVGTAGDLNGDGIADVAIGAPGADSYAGQSYVVFGRHTAQAGNFPAVLALNSLLPTGGGDGSTGFVLNGIRSYSGVSLSAAGDVNGDGIGDLIVGAPGGGPQDIGHSYVLFGRDTAQAGSFPALFPFENLLPGNGGDGSAGFIVTGAETFRNAGGAVSAAGDVNGDGIGDLIIGAASSSRGGACYVVFGRDTGMTGNFPPVLSLVTLLPDAGGDGSTGFVLPGIEQGDATGYSVSAAGDVNGDGIGDLIVGAPYAYVDRQRYAGRVYVVFGRDTAADGGFPAVFPLALLLPDGGGDGSAGFVLNGISGIDLAGKSVSTAGDVNADGIDDVIIGAYRAAHESGEIFVVFGRDTAQSGDFPPELSLASLFPPSGDGSAGFVLIGRDRSNAGGSVNDAGDVNGDGIGDLIIGAEGAYAGGRLAGQTYVVFGRDSARADAFPAVFFLASLLPGGGGDGSAGFAMNGITSSERSGHAANRAGDVNGDGIEDVIVGAFYAGRNNRNETGRAYVVFGRAPSH